MCGITGFLNLNSFNQETATPILKEMTNLLTHRGPDSSGYWLRDQPMIALGHRRLSILDLSINKGGLEKTEDM